MKKLLALLFISSLLLQGCSSAKSEVQNTEQVSTQSSAVATDSEEVETESVDTENSTQAEDKSFFAALPDTFTYSSGAGAWSTELKLSDDGSFTGYYHDSDMGDIGDDNPNGTEYESTFSGKFSEPTKVSDYVYTVKLESITQEKTPGTEEYKDGVKYVYSAPTGLETADEIYVYLPGAKVADLSEDFIMWTPLVYEDTKPETIDFYGMYSVNDEAGFVGYSQ